MALINCLECEKEISDKAVSCPNCGCPIDKQSNNTEEEYLCCPKCHSKELHSEHKGFSGGKALAGAVLTGGIGLLAGTIGSKNVQITCLKCGKKFKAGKALIISEKKENEINKELNHIITSQGNQAAYRYYKEQTGTEFEESIEYVNNYISFNKITSRNTGCAGIILLFIILTGTLITMSVAI